MSFLVSGLRLSERRNILKDILENAVPITLQDVVPDRVKGDSGGAPLSRRSDGGWAGQRVY